MPRIYSNHTGLGAGFCLVVGVWFLPVSKGGIEHIVFSPYRCSFDFEFEAGKIILLNEKLVSLEAATAGESIKANISLTNKTMNVLSGLKIGDRFQLFEMGKNNIIGPIKPVGLGIITEFIDDAKYIADAKVSISKQFSNKLDNKIIGHTYDFQFSGDNQTHRGHLSRESSNSKSLCGGKEFIYLCLHDYSSGKPFSSSFFNILKDGKIIRKGEIQTRIIEHPVRMIQPCNY